MGREGEKRGRREEEGRKGIGGSGREREGEGGGGRGREREGEGEGGRGREREGERTSFQIPRDRKQVLCAHVLHLHEPRQYSA